MGRIRLTFDVVDDLDFQLHFEGGSFNGIFLASSWTSGGMGRALIRYNTNSGNSSEPATWQAMADFLNSNGTIGRYIDNVTVNSTKSTDSTIGNYLDSIVGNGTGQFYNVTGQNTRLDGVITRSGTITATDSEDDASGAGLTYSAGLKPDTRDYGDLIMTSDGNWTFTIDDTKPDFDSLDSGSTDHATYVITVTDSDGNMTSQDLAIPIEGIDEPLGTATEYEFI